MKNLKLRPVVLEDAAVLLAIYKPFVESEDRQLSDVSFEYVAPTVEEFEERIRNISATYPYLVLEEEGQAVGYAYAHPYIQREAYQWSAELTIYLGPSGQNKGYGRILYGAVEKILFAQGIINAYACITKSNLHSVGFHSKLGYTVNGEFPCSGFKHGHWLDMVWMKKELAAYPEKPELIKGWQELDQHIIDEALKL